MKQASLFAEIDAQATLERHKRSWELCWNWGGPKVGGLCETHTIAPEGLFQPRGYCYTEQCRLLCELPDGRWVARIEMGEVHGNPWWKDGTMLLLEITDIAPPVRALRHARERAYSTEIDEVARAVS